MEMSVRGGGRGWKCSVGTNGSGWLRKQRRAEVLKGEAYAAGDLGVVVHIAYFRMDEMMRGQRGWRELQALGDKINQFSGIIEGLIWSPKASDSNDRHDDWAFEESGFQFAELECLVMLESNFWHFSSLYCEFFCWKWTVQAPSHPGDMKFKQNKFLPPDKQILTANPDINIVELCDDDEFIVLACDGIWDCMSSQQLVDFIREHIDTKLNELSPFVWLGMLLFAFLIDTCSDGGLAFLLDT
ncbi:putative protein phosphatase 2C 58 [Zea mays]|uniref:protein-serine/threonine phosphatase n=1 Tax=Zea mays TaxID=4577 RepID=A0A3L6G8F6_MAIZE|nr:putative protein phosphatase 2C 58 [Zea mays]